MQASIYPSQGRINGRHPIRRFFAGSKTLLNAKKPHQATAAVITEHELIDWRAHPLAGCGVGREGGVVERLGISEGGMEGEAGTGGMEGAGGSLEDKGGEGVERTGKEQEG